MCTHMLVCTYTHTHTDANPEEGDSVACPGSGHESLDSPSSQRGHCPAYTGLKRGPSAGLPPPVPLLLPPPPPPPPLPPPHSSSSRPPFSISSPLLLLPPPPIFFSPSPLPLLHPESPSSRPPPPLKGWRFPEAVTWESGLSLSPQRGCGGLPWGCWASETTSSQGGRL